MREKKELILLCVLKKNDVFRKKNFGKPIFTLQEHQRNLTNLTISSNSDTISIIL